MVRLTSAIETPCFRTLSRSTVAKTCGTHARKNVLIVPISGRLRASRMNRSVSAARSAGVLPLWSCSMNVKPAPVPRPGMAGGPKATTIPSGISCAKRRLSAAIISKLRSSFAFRSSQGFNDTKKNPELGVATPVIRLYPASVV